MFPHHSHVATELSAITKKGAKFKRTPNCQAALDTLKLELAKRVMLTYPNFSKPFEIYTDASKLQLGRVILQENNPLAFYSYKITDAQTIYTVIKLELLSIVETLQEFYSILVRHQININADHKNFTLNNFTTDCVCLWRFNVEEYSPTIYYIKVVHNIIAYAFLNSLTNSHVPEKIETCFLMETENFPLAFVIVEKAQADDKKLQETLNQSPM